MTDAAAQAADSAACTAAEAWNAAADAAARVSGVAGSSDECSRGGSSHGIRSSKGWE
jgi:hypothetical protein